MQGRENEWKLLSSLYTSKKSSLAAVYGRRRIGKSTLLTAFCKEHQGIYFEGLEGLSLENQIQHFLLQIKQQSLDKYADALDFKTWSETLDYFTDLLKKQKHKNKLVVVFDEFQWMAGNKSSLVSMLKFYWDNYWKNLNILLILCGSVCNFIFKKVIQSQALYGRFDLYFKLGPLDPATLRSILKNKVSPYETIKYMLLFGGIPKYFELIEPKKSFAANIENLCFSKDSFFSTEFDKIFYSQFRRHTYHEKIVALLSKKPLTLEELSTKINRTSSGGIKRYLDELEEAFFVSSTNSIFNKGHKGRQYKVTDEYLRFYFKYIAPNRNLIQKGLAKDFFEKQISNQWQPWLGLSFENFVVRNMNRIIEKLNLVGKIKSIGSYTKRNHQGGIVAQVDLLIEATDFDLYVFEIKYQKEPITTRVLKDFENKIKQLPSTKKYSIKKVLVTAFGASKELVDSEEVDFIFTIDDFF